MIRNRKRKLGNTKTVVNSFQNFIFKDDSQPIWKEGFRLYVVNSFQNFIFKDDSQQVSRTISWRRVVNSFQNFIFKDDSQLLSYHNYQRLRCE